MTIRNRSLVEAESYDNLLAALDVTDTFADLTGHQLSEFTIADSDILPVTLVREVLDAAPREYIIETPESGQAPRYRVFELDDAIESGDSDGS